ncbi:LCP family protein [uncultured Jatrophihabitans sp.]|uniref:LCP family protein n=1 Tax=uncultured Jatrophihabitans sp. TaxID=1610747 RepID=UPI0035CC5EB1
MTDAQLHRPSGQHRTGRGRTGTVSALRLLGKIVAAIVSASLLVGAGYFRTSYTSLERGLHRVSVGGLGQPAPVARGDTPKQVDGSAQNLLVIGDDDRSGLTPQEIETLHVGAASPTTSTDTLLLVHVPANGAKATLISIPRDSYVAIPGFKNAKINAAYIDGAQYGTDGFPVTSSSSDAEKQAAGITLLIRVLKNLTGLRIDHYVLVNFLGFFHIAQAIKGVTVNLCHAVDDSRSGFVQSAGVHHLTPVQALEFVRQRHNLSDAQGHQLNDFGREARQRYFLAAAFNKIETAGTLLNPSRLNGLIAAIKSTLTIDDGLSLTTLAHQMLDLTSGNIAGQTIPTEGSQMFPAPVGSALIVDPATVQRQIQRWLHPSRAGPSSTPGGSTRTSSTSAAPSKSGSAAPAQHGCIN